MSRPPVLLLALLCLAVMLAGCKAAPRTLSESSEQRLDADAYWVSHSAARLPASDQPRSIALAEVVVEFVTSKNQAGGRQQAAFIPPHPIFLAASAAGVGRKNVEFPEDASRRIADHIADALVTVLRDHGLAPIANDLVVDADAYAALQPLAEGEPRDVREINLAATDTGRVREMRQLPALGTRIVTATNHDADTADAALLTELGVDAVLRATIRVGVYLERASLEEGSRITLTTPAGVTHLAARRSLLSDDPVLDESSDSTNLKIDPQAYLDAIDATAPAFLRMALDALSPPPARAPARP
ncbi:MAG: hypothetical protein R3B57_04410 [Phycisphaerales bacterium]